jgi:hypothetical protein
VVSAIIVVLFKKLVASRKRTRVQPRHVSRRRLPGGIEGFKHFLRVTVDVAARTCSHVPAVEMGHVAGVASVSGVHVKLLEVVLQNRLVR